MVRGAAVWAASMGFTHGPICQAPDELYPLRVPAGGTAKTEAPSRAHKKQSEAGVLKEM